MNAAVARSVDRYQGCLVDGVRREWLAQVHANGRAERPYVAGDVCEVTDQDGDQWRVEPVWIVRSNGTDLYFRSTSSPIDGAVEVWRWESRGWAARRAEINAALERIGPTDASVLFDSGLLRVFIAGRHDERPPVPALIPLLLAELADGAP